MYLGLRQVRFEDKGEKAGGWICVVDMPNSKFTTQMELSSAMPRAPYRIWLRPISEGGMFQVRSGLGADTVTSVLSALTQVLSLVQTESLYLSDQKSRLQSVLPAHATFQHLGKRSRNPRPLVIKCKSLPLSYSLATSKIPHGKVTSTCYPDDTWGPLTCMAQRHTSCGPLGWLLVKSWSFQWLERICRYWAWLGHVKQN